jgi:hypothetical protein
MKKIMVALAALATIPGGRALAEPTSQETSVHVAPYVGAFVPTGKLRDVLDDSVLTGVSVSVDATEFISFVGSFAWAPTEVKDLSNATLDLFQYDVGIQGQYPLRLSGEWFARPFLGAGVGARTYHYRDLDIGKETDFVGYFSAGGTFAYRKLEMSLTARDYISHYEGLGLRADDLNQTRNDLALFASIGASF